MVSKGFLKAFEGSWRFVKEFWMGFRGLRGELRRVLTRGSEGFRRFWRVLEGVCEGWGAQPKRHSDADLRRVFARWEVDSAEEKECCGAKTLKMCSVILEPRESVLSVRDYVAVKSLGQARWQNAHEKNVCADGVLFIYTTRRLPGD